MRRIWALRPSFSHPPPLSTSSSILSLSLFTAPFSVQFSPIRALFRRSLSTSSSPLPALYSSRFPASCSMGSEKEEIEWPAKKVRDTFINFFEEKNHVNWKSSHVVPHNDPTLLFANAGMNQYKPIFLGTADPNTQLSKLTRACNTQKCIYTQTSIQSKSNSANLTALYVYKG